MKKKIFTNLSWLVCVNFFVFNAALPTSTFAKKVEKEAKAATVTVTGTVTDENSQPIPGASIYVKDNRQQGTTTDVNGKYTIEVEAGTVLVFSYVGYLPQEIPAANGNAINVKLNPSSNDLNEVVAVGYQTLRRSDVTGAISSVKASEMNINAPTLGQALVGKAAGVNVSQTSGAPYQSPKIRVRGIGSFSASSDPLYVIDGYPAASNVFINPEDIESIDILKDAASAAIYGSRASGGVILITTKRGKKGKGKFEYDVQTGVSQLGKKVKLLNSDQFTELLIDARNNAYHDLWVNGGHTWSDAMKSDDNATRIKNVGSAGSVSIPDYLYDFATQTAKPQTVNTDWQDELYRNAFFQRHTLSFSGGSEKTRYYLSGGYQDQDGIVLGSGQQRYNFTGNVDGDINSRIHVGANVNFTQNTNQETQEGRFDHGPILGALIYMPIFAAYNEDGTLKTNEAASQSSAFGFQSIENPVALATRTKINRKGYRTNINANASYRIVDDLHFKVNLGTYTYNEKYDYYKPTTLSSGANPPGSAQAIAAATATAMNTSVMDQLAEFTLNYKKDFKKNHIDAIGGYTAQKNTTDIVSVVANGFQNDNIPEITAKGADPSNFTLYTGSGSATYGLNPTGRSTYTLVSYLGRVNYNYDEKYFLTGTFRTDGSSRFGPENKYGYFPSIAAGWALSNESFYNDWLGKNSTIKLRASWGKSGNYNIGNYSYLQTLGGPTGAVFGSSSTVTTATYPDNITDVTLSWESTQQYNFGTDITMFNNRLSLLVNYYRSYSTDILYRQPISAISGSSTILTNLSDSKIRNQGWDFQADARVINRNKFSFNVSGNININRNKVTQLSGNNTIIINGAERSYLTNITQEGYPVGMFYGFKVAGMVTEDNIESVAPSASQSNPLHVGDLYFEDVNGDGIVNDLDKTVIGNPYPKFTYGFALNASYDRLSVSASFNGSYGNQILDGQDYYLFNMEASGNQYVEATDRYRSAAEPGDGTVYRPSRAGTQSNSTRLSTFYLQSGSYLRCTNISVSYTFPKPFNGAMGLGSVNVFANVLNAFTISKYKGYNPDVDYNYTSGTSNNTQPANLAPGVDYGVYPLVRSYNFGLRVSFE